MCQAISSIRATPRRWLRRLRSFLNCRISAQGWEKPRDGFSSTRIVRRRRTGTCWLSTLLRSAISRRRGRGDEAPMALIVVNGEGSAEDYFLGKRFSSNLTVTVKPDGDVLPRMERLTGLAQGRSVLHIGCCDHAPILDRRVDGGLWLHASLTQTAERCLGIDIDVNAVDQVKARTGFDNVIAADVTKPGIADIVSSQW